MTDLHRRPYRPDWTGWLSAALFVLGVALLPLAWSARSPQGLDEFRKGVDGWTAAEMAGICGLISCATGSGFLAPLLSKRLAIALEIASALPSAFGVFEVAFGVLFTLVTPPFELVGCGYLGLALLATGPLFAWIRAAKLALTVRAPAGTRSLS